MAGLLHCTLLIVPCKYRVPIETFTVNASTRHVLCKERQAVPVYAAVIPTIPNKLRRSEKSPSLPIERPRWEQTHDSGNWLAERIDTRKPFDYHVSMLVRQRGLKRVWPSWFQWRLRKTPLRSFHRCEPSNTRKPTAGFQACLRGHLRAPAQTHHEEEGSIIVKNK